MMEVRPRMHATPTGATPTGSTPTGSNSRGANSRANPSGGRRRLESIAFVAGAALLLSGCGIAGGSEAAEPAGSADSSATVEVTDNHGTIEVPVNPERVVALDNLTAQILSDWDVDVVAAPKQLFRLWPAYSEEPEVIDVGSHREPDLEQIVAADADLIIAGGRFGAYYEELAELNPNIIDLTVREDQDHSEELKRQADVLGQIFDRENEAADLIAAFDASIEAAQQAYNDDDTVLGLITSGGQILYAAPREG